MIFEVLTIFFSIINLVSAEIFGDYNCTYFVNFATTDVFRYSPSAVSCPNLISDAACAVLYPPVGNPPIPDQYANRPLQCYTTGTGKTAPIVEDMKRAAVATCPKSCGYCCLTPEYKCSNVAYPRLNCATITQAQCNSLSWRTIIAQDCPNSCGFCNMGGCVDAIMDCAHDVSICNVVGMQDFVNQYCQKTCARCPSTTAASALAAAVAASSCTTYAADSSPSCAAWAKNGFCTNMSYTLAQRKSFCARTCRIC